jgi:hypothetical protein
MSPGDGGQLQPLLDPTDEYDRDEDFELEERQKLEAALVKKVDKRMSILVLIYILNCGLYRLSLPMH